MKILLLDIETSPYTAYIWRLNQKWINPENLINTAQILCWSAKWLGEKDVYYSSIHHTDAEDMLRHIHSLMSRADAIVHYNGSQFDIPILNREFLLYGLKPPPPAKEIDLLKVVRKRFKFPSSSLNYVSRALNLGQKTQHKGFKLWTDCMQGNPDAWKLMEEYNKNDVILLELVYNRLLPWIKSHPNRSLHADNPVCSNCGSDHIQRRGYHYTATAKYQRFVCNDCGTWGRLGKSEAPKERFVNV